MSISFRRIRGRIIPINSEKKGKVKGSAQIAAGAGVSIASGVYAGKLLNKSTAAFSHSAKLRGASKLVMGRGSSTYSNLIKAASLAKVKGLRFSKASSAVLLAGTTAGGILASMGANNILKYGKDRDKRALKIEAVGLAIGSVGLLPFGKLAKLSNVVRMARLSKSKNPVKDIFNAWSKSGMKKTSSTVNKFTKAQYKGFTPKPPTVYNAKQQDLFGAKKFNLDKWFKKGGL